METPMCRICLAQNIRMYPIVNTDLQQVFEKLTNYVLMTEARPLLVCYVCYARLQHCYQLMIKSYQSEKILVQMMNSEGCHLIDVKPPNTLCVTSLPQINIIDINTVASMSYHVDIKQETITEDYDDVKIKVEIEENEVESTEPCFSPLQNVSTFDLKKPQSQQNEAQPIATNVITWSEPELLVVRKTKTSGTSKCKSKNQVPVTKSNSADEPQKEIDKTPSSELSVGEKPYKCNLCQKGFSHKKTLNGHIRIHMGSSPYKCDVCRRCFAVPSALAVHARAHSGERPYRCAVCAQAFSRRSCLLQHQHVHSGLKPYSCHVCSRSYNTKFNLNKHFRKHTQTKPFQCSVCQNSFSQKSSLDRHMHLHSDNNRINKCEQCQSTFCRKSALLRHMRIHTGIKPYKCDTCDRSFTDKSNLGRHMRKHR